MPKLHRLNVKPLSMNNAYRGRRFATPELKSYKMGISLLLPKQSVPRGKLRATYRFGVSSKASDVDNLVKVTQDAIAEKYGFNDRMIYRLDVEKVDVPIGKEFVEFAITML